MSTLRTTNVIHGSSAISNIVLDNQGRAIFGPNSPAGKAALYVNAQNNRVGVNTETPSVELDVDGQISSTGNATVGGTLSVTGNVNIDSGTLFVDAVNNRVGVNTTTPSTSFEVAGGPAWFQQSSRSINGNAASLQTAFVQQAGSNTAAIQVSDGSQVNASTNWDGQAYFGSNFGIGTTTPTRPDGTTLMNPATTRALTIYGANPGINIIASSATGYSLINCGRTGGSTNPYRAGFGYDQVNDTGLCFFNNVFEFRQGPTSTTYKLKLENNGNILSPVGGTFGASLNANLASGATSDGFAVRSGTNKRVGIDAAGDIKLGSDIKSSNNIYLRGSDGFISAGGVNTPTSVLHTRADCTSGTGDSFRFESSSGGGANGYLKYEVENALNGQDAIKHRKEGYIGKNTYGLEISSASTLSGSFTSTGQAAIRFYYPSAGGGSQAGAQLEFWTNSNGFNGTNYQQRMTIDNNGNIGAPNGSNIYSASDERLKENITDLTDGLDKIKKLKPISYTWKNGWCPTLNGLTQYGFGAQTTATVDPVLVEGFGKDQTLYFEDETIQDPLRVNDKFIIPLLVKALQEATEKIESLETRIASLENT